MDLPEGRIECQETMILLGYAFGSRPSVEAHVNHIKKKFVRLSWLPRHLKSAGISAVDI